MIAPQAAFVQRGKEQGGHGRLAFLDSVRGIAAFSVVIQHVFERTYPSFANWSLSYFDFGMFGVVVFFLVSGFIIPTSIERHASVPRFWIGRFFRLYPIYWVSLLAALALGYVHLVPLPDVSRSKLFLGNMTMLQEAIGIPHAIGVYWTLSLELIFYVACSALFAASVLRRSQLWSWLSILLAFALNAGVALVFHRSIPAGRLGLLITAFFGTVLFRLHCGEIPARNVWRLVPALAVSLLTGFWIRGVLYPKMGEQELSLSSMIVSWVCGYVLVGIVFYYRNRTFPVWSRYLGQISYSLYLIHGLVLYSLPGSGITWALLTIGVSIALSSLTFRFIEQPCQRLGARLSKPS